MKLSTFNITTPAGTMSRLGLLVEKRFKSLHADDEAVTSYFFLLDLNAAYTAMIMDTEQRPEPKRWADFLFPGDMRAFLELGKPATDAAQATLDWFQKRYNTAETDPATWRDLHNAFGARLIYRSDKVRLRTPIPNPRTLRDFLTFETHVENGSKRRNESIPEAWYKMPVYYKGNPTTLIGSDEDVEWPSYSRLLDYELELAIVIGKEGREIPVAEASDYIAGYTIMNDFSARDVQKGEMQCRLGPAKAKDFGTAVGPWLVTPDEIPDPRNLRMIARINDEVWSDGNAGTSYWTFEQMIAHVSREETLYPGDILASGTVGFGCGLELDRWLKSGDVVELEIDHLGILRNRILAPKEARPLFDIPQKGATT